MAVFLTAPFVLKPIWLKDDKINYTITELPTNNTSSTTKSKPAVAALFSFDPNKASEEDLQRLGIEEFLAKRIINYRNKGGYFRTKKDLLKIYDFPENLYTSLQPYILLPDSLPHHSYINSKITPFDLNDCDTTALIKLQGIGSVLAAQIVNYRSRLGGFVKTTQVQEVYGIAPEVAKTIEPYLFIKSGFKPKKINLNLSTADELSAHPYLTKKGANVIVNYRNEHGPYKSVRDLNAVKIFTTEQINKLLPYFEVK